MKKRDIIRILAKYIYINVQYNINNVGVRVSLRDAQEEIYTFTMLKIKVFSKP